MIDPNGLCPEAETSADVPCGTANLVPEDPLGAPDTLQQNNNGDVHDPTSGGSQQNSGNDCPADDPLCHDTIGGTSPGDVPPSLGTVNTTGPGPGDKFATIADAGAIAAAYAYWQTAPGYAYGGGGEWGGEIYQNSDGTYSFDAGRSGGSTSGFGLVENGVNIYPSAIPDGTTLVGDYHSEGVNPDAAPSAFSTGDIQGINNLYATNPNYGAAFVATPTGSVLSYLPGLGATVPICNSCLGPPR